MSPPISAADGGRDIYAASNAASVGNDGGRDYIYMGEDISLTGGGKHSRVDDMERGALDASHSSTPKTQQDDAVTAEV